MDITTSANGIALGLSQLHTRFVKDEQRKARYKIEQYDNLSVTAKILTSEYERYKRKYETTTRLTSRKAMKLETLRKDSESAERALAHFNLFVTNDNQWDFIDGLDSILKEFALLIDSIKDSDDVGFAVVVLQGSEHNEKSVNLVVRTIHDWETLSGC